MLVARLQCQHLIAHRAELRLGRGERGLEGAGRRRKSIAFFTASFSCTSISSTVRRHRWKAERLRLDVGIVGGHDWPPMT